MCLKPIGSPQHVPPGDSAHGNTKNVFFVRKALCNEYIRHNEMHEFLASFLSFGFIKTTRGFDIKLPRSFSWALFSGQGSQGSVFAAEDSVGSV